MHQRKDRCQEVQARGGQVAEGQKGQAWEVGRGVASDGGRLLDSRTTCPSATAFSTGSLNPFLTSLAPPMHISHTLCRCSATWS